MKKLKLLLPILTAILALVITVHASAPTASGGEDALPQASHVHPVCGSTCDCENGTHGDRTWTAWNGTSSTRSGYSYYLTRDVTRESTYTFSGSGTIRICLNGHTINTNGYSVGFEVGEGFTLILCDCVGGGGIISDDGEYTSFGSEEYALYNNGKLTVYGGIFKGGDSAVFNEQDSTFLLVGGNLSGGMQALHNYGTATISGGYLSNLATYADGVYNSGTLTVSGGNLTGYDAVINNKTLTVTGGYFGGVSHGLCNYGTATVSGGICYASDGFSVENAGTLHLSGGTLRKSETSDALWVSNRYARTYLSGKPSVASICVTYPDTLYAADQLQTDPYQGSALSLEVRTYYFSAGDAAVCAVSDSTAPLFVIPEDADYTLIREGSELVVYQTVASGQCGAQGDNLLWSLDNGGTLTVTGTGDMKDYTYWDSSSPPPWTSYRSQLKKVVVVEGATSIGDNAFNGFGEITSVTLPSTMTRLGNSAFYNGYKLASINLPDRISYVGSYCFQYCYVLAIDRLPTGIKVYQPYSFRNVGANLDSLPPLVIPEGVTEIGDGAFAEWYDLTSLTLPSTLVTVGNQAFYKNRVTSVHIPASVRSIGSDAFGWESTDTLTYLYFCGDAPDVSRSLNRPFLSKSAIKLFFPENAQGFDASGYSAYDKSVWDDKDHCTLRGRYVSSTCSEGGYDEYYCPRCPRNYKAYDGSKPLPHTPESFPGQPATCFADGYTEGTSCKICYAILTGHEPIPAGHSYGGWSVRTAPTLLLPGEEFRACSACSHEETRPIPAAGPAAAAGISALWNGETRTLTLSGIPEHVTVLAGFYDGGRFVSSRLTTEDGSITLPEDVIFSSITLYFLTDSWQPISSQLLLL